MNYKEFGENDRETLVLLHGGGLSWWNYREAAALLQDRYHIVVPILDGHAGSDRGFASIEENARTLCDYLDAACPGGAAVLAGLSLGAQVALEMLSQRPDICRCALIESALAIPMKVTGAMLPAAMGMSYGLIRQRWFAKAQFKALRIQPALFEDYYRDSAAIRKADYIAFLSGNASYAPKEGLRRTGANVWIAVGGKERKNMLRSAELLQGMIPGSRKIILPGYSHGDLSLNHPEEYARMLTALAAE